MAGQLVTLETTHLHNRPGRAKDSADVLASVDVGLIDVPPADMRWHKGPDGFVHFLEREDTTIRQVDVNTVLIGMVHHTAGLIACEAVDSTPQERFGHRLGSVHFGYDGGPAYRIRQFFICGDAQESFPVGESPGGFFHVKLLPCVDDVHPEPFVFIALGVQPGFKGWVVA